MAFEKKWQFDINRPYGDDTSALTDTEKYAIWYYKAFLTGQIGGATQALWTVVGSSDGATAGMDGVDRWGSPFDPTKIVYGYGATAHSWVVLQSPLMNRHTYYLLVAYNTSYTYAVNISLGVDSPPTGGSTTVNPTMVNGTTVSVCNFHHNTNPGSIHMHGALAKDGSFSILVSRDNTGKFSSGFIVHLLANARPGDGYPVWMFMDADTALSTGFGSAAVGLDIKLSGFMRAPDNSVAGNWSGVLPSATNFPGGTDMFDGSVLDWDMWVGASTAAYRSIRGRIQDIAYIGTGPATGSIDDTGGAPSYMVVGNYWFPTNDAPNL